MLNSMMPSLLRSGFEDDRRALATLLWSCGRLTYANPEFLERAQDGVRAHLEGFNTKDLVQILQVSLFWPQARVCLALPVGVCSWSVEL